MTSEEKHLLLKDLCARLPYGVKTSNDHGILELTPRTDVIYIVDNGHIPYLRPMSSMTREERAFYFAIDESSATCIDWLNARHFDYRGLIEKGLALEAPEEMYNSSQNGHHCEVV